MSDIELKNISKTFGDTKVIDNVSLTIRAREFMVFLGPSGCGKSTLLRMIAGLETIDEGEIWIDGRRVDRLPPGERQVAMVFQHYALYPHMTVRENMSFGLRNVRMPVGAIERRVNEAAKMLEISHLLDRKPAQISGGQRQRVAIGRAIVKEPKLFLFDEPLSNLDAALRVRTRLELAQLHQRVGAAMIFVTHDQVEAMTLAQRIIVMNGRKIEQIGTPMEIYSRPATQFVARFVGTPAMNIVPVRVVSAEGVGAAAPAHSATMAGAHSHATVAASAVGRTAAPPAHSATATETHSHATAVAVAPAQSATAAEIPNRAVPIGGAAMANVPTLRAMAGSSRFVRIALPDNAVVATLIDSTRLPARDVEIRLGIRAESIDIVAPNAGDTRGRVKFVERLGDRTLVYVCLADDTTLVAEDVGMSKVSLGDTVGLKLDPAAAHLFDDHSAYHAVVDSES